MQFLADTWWYGLTRRFSEARFRDLARQRASEGFSAVQIVVGIPPEVGPRHPQAESDAGCAWDPEGRPNPRYLALARARLERLLAEGLTPVVYGGWGPQIEWLGAERMAAWWRALLRSLDDLDVIYCLAGELDLWLDRPACLLPDRATDSLRLPTGAHAWARRRAHGALARLGVPGFPSHEARRKRRREAWTHVLREVAGRTGRPILAHTVPPTLGSEAVDRPELLAAETVQTGHTRGARDWLWQWPSRHVARGTDQPFVNLEPWYEGIAGDFYGDDQLAAYWLSMLAGASAHAYGAHGIWNAGDGRFLSHWGPQTFEQARRLRSPSRLGEAHAQFVSSGIAHGVPRAHVEDGALVYVERRSETRMARYFVTENTLEWSRP